MPIEVIVKLLPTVQASARLALETCARDLGVSIAPLHASTTDRELASYFVTNVASSALDDVLAQLRRCPGVDAAYAKPAGEPPGRM